MANGFVHDEVVDELSKLVRTLENSITKGKKKKNDKKINKISECLKPQVLMLMKKALMIIVMMAIFKIILLLMALINAKYIV